MYKAQSPHLETQGASEVLEEQDEQVQVPVDQVGGERRTGVPAAALLLLRQPRRPVASLPTPPPSCPGLYDVLRPLPSAPACPSDPAPHISHLPISSSRSATGTLLNTGHSL